MGRIHEQPVGTLTDESTLLFEQLNGATWNSKSIAWSNIKSQIAASGFITNTVSNLTNYYLKSETYTQAEVNALISAINTGRFEVVQTLPATGEAKVIYLVPKDPGETQNVYDEYIYINNAWEKIGDTTIDLSNYVTTDALNTALQSYYTQTQIDTLLDGKVDKVSGKGLSTNDFTTADKTKLDGIAENATKVESSATNGNIRINGTETQVYDDTELNTDIEDLQDITSTEKITTAESNPVQLTTKSAQNALSCVVKMDATQDLHGYDKPWAGGEGKNLFENTATTKTINGVTFTVNSDGTVIANGTATANAILWAMGTSSLDPKDFHVNDEVILTGCPSGGSSSTYRVSMTERLPNNIQHSDTGSGVTFTMANDTTACTSGIIIYAGYAANNLVFKPMLRLATESDPTFEPYSNICPIEGMDEVSVIVKDGNDVTRKTIDIDLEQTIYGGAVDAATGELTQTHAYIASYNGESINEPWISSMDEYVAGTVPSIGAEVVYPLSTPNLYDIDSHKVPLLEGVNTVSTDGTSVRLVYRDGKFATLEELQDAETAVQAFQEYSYRERVIGKWINKKPLYEITIHTGQISAYSNMFPTGVSNIEDLVDLKGYAKSASEQYPVPFFLGNFNYIITLTYFPSSNEIRVEKGSGLPTLTDSYLFIRYTKTTDSPS